MGTWAVPYENIKTAKKFATKMKKPWRYKTSAEMNELAGLCGSDTLEDRLLEIKNTADIRPLVKKTVQGWMRDFEKYPDTQSSIEAVNIVREAVGLKPLDIGKMKKSQEKERERWRKKAKQQRQIEKEIREEEEEQASNLPLTDLTNDELTWAGIFGIEVRERLKIYGDKFSSHKFGVVGSFTQSQLESTGSKHYSKHLREGLFWAKFRTGAEANKAKNHIREYFCNFYVGVSERWRIGTRTEVVGTNVILFFRLNPKTTDYSGDK